MQGDACRVDVFAAHGRCRYGRQRSWWTTTLRPLYDRSPVQFTHFGEGIDLRDGYCWSIPKRRKSCLGHAFVEGPKSLESNAVTAAVSRGKRMTNSIRAFFRAPEWKDSFDNTRHERPLAAVRCSTCLEARPMDSVAQESHTPMGFPGTSEKFCTPEQYRLCK